MDNADKIFRHIGKHLDSVDDLSDEFLAECFTKSTRDATTFADGLVEQWEEELGIEFPAVLLADRQAQLNAKLRAVGGDNFAYFENIASALGYNIDSAVDPHLRITDGDFLPFRADVSQADIDKVWDQEVGQSRATWCVRGTDVESDTDLQDIFNSQKPEGSDILFINE
jgi:uncharacterized protein YmfQ (DUF2313 family)